MGYSSNIILDERTLREAVDYFMQRDAFAYDTEAYGPNRGVVHLAPTSWISFATQGRAFVVPMGHPNGDRLISKATRKLDKETRKFTQIPAVWSAPPPQLRPSVVYEMLEPLFFSEDHLKIAHGMTYDVPVVAKYYGGQIPVGPYADTIVMSWLLDENRRQHNLKTLTTEVWGHDYDSEGIGKCVEAHPFSKVAKYSYRDAKYDWMHWRRFDAQIARWDLDRVMELEMALIPVLSKMRLTGARVDFKTLEGLYDQFSEELVELEAAVYKAAGQRFNINSTPQKQKILYSPKKDGGQGLRPFKKTKTGNDSTDAESLEAHPQNALCRALIEYADVDKMLNTYVIGYTGVEGDPKKPCRIFDGRIHADFVQYGTVTGRFSCREPNLQNIPRPDTDKGKQIRGLFMADPGYKLVVADYGQIELVVLAHYSRAKALVDGFNNGIDAHTMTASKVFGVPFDKVEKSMRSAAKGINFAVVYGAGPDKVAAMADTSVAKAKEFLKIHQREFPEIYIFKENVLRVAKQRKPPHIRTLLGRYRRLPALNYSNKDLRAYAERQAVNSLIQGSAADIIKTAMVRLDQTLPEGMDMLLTVHDELVTRAPIDRADECATIVREAMLGEGISRLLNVPMTIDLKIVDKWSEAK